MQQKGKRRSQPRKSLDKDQDAAIDAQMAAEDLENEEEADAARAAELSELDRWTLEDFRVFHEAEVKRHQDAHQTQLNREREECRLIVEQSTQGHAAAQERIRSAICVNITRLFRTSTLSQTIWRWQSSACIVRRRRHLDWKARLLCLKKGAGPFLEQWMTSFERRKRRNRTTSRFLLILAERLRKDVMISWIELVRERRVAMGVQIGKYQRMVTSACVRIESEAFFVCDTWLDCMDTEQERRHIEYEQARLDQQRCDEMEQLKKRHHTQLSDWRLEFEAKLKDSKDKLKGAHESLKPLQIWRWCAVCRVLCAACCCLLLPSVRSFCRLL